MALTVAELNTKLTADISQFSSAIDKAEKQAASAFDKIGKAGDKMRDIGKKMTTFVTLPLVGAGAAAFKMSSDLAESLNAADVAFGQSSKEVKKWAKDLPSAFGFTQKGALDAAAGFKLVAKDAKLTSKDFTALAERAADLGSVFNVETTEAANALKSALVGEMEPARRLGVVLNAAKIEARALAMGFKQVGGELPVAAKQAAIYAEIMEQTSFAQGDATKTAGTAAGQMRTLKADAGRAAEELGTKLIPIAVKLLDKLQGLVDWFTSLSSSQQEMLITLGLVVVAIGPAITVIGNLITVVKALQVAMLFLAANPLVAIVAAIGLLVAALVTAYTKSQTFRDVVNAAFQAVVNGILDAVGWILQGVGKIIGVFATMAEAASKIPGIGDKFKGVAESLRDAQHTVERWAETAHRGINLVTSDAERAANAVRGLERSMDSLRSKPAIGVPFVPGMQARPLPVMHSGGVVPGPRGADVPIMAQAGERVIPAGGGGAGGGVSITIQGDVIGGSPGEIAAKLQEMLLAHQRRSGPLGFRQN